MHARTTTPRTTTFGHISHDDQLHRRFRAGWKLACSIAVIGAGLMAGRAMAGPPGSPGHLFVSGFSSNNVVEFDENGAFVRVFIASGAGLDNPAGIAWGPNGNLFVCNFGASSANPALGFSVLEFDGQTGAFVRKVVGGYTVGAGAVPESGWLYWPSALMFTPDGRMLVTGYGNDAVLVYDPQTSEWLDTWIGGIPTGGLDSPRGIALAANGNVIVTAGETIPWAEPGQVVEFNPTTGRLERIIVSGMDQSTRGTAIADSGNVWIVQYWAETAMMVGPGKLLQIDSVTGAVVTSADIVKPRGLVLAPNSDVLVAHQAEVVRFSGVTGQPIGTFASSSQLSNAEGMAFKPFPAPAGPTPSVASVSTPVLDACDGRVSVTITGANLDPATTDVWLSAVDTTNILGAVTGGTATELTVEFNLGAGIPSGARNVVVKNADGQTAVLPDGITVDACQHGREGNLFAVGYRHRQTTRSGIFEFDGATGNVVGFVHEAELDLRWSLTSSNSLAFAPNGTMLVSARDDGESPSPILAFDGITGKRLGDFIPGGTGGMESPVGLTFGPNGNLFVMHRLYLSGAPDPCGVLEFDGRTGEFVREVVPLGACGLFYDSGYPIAFGPNGDIYANTLGSGILRFDGVSGACAASQPFIPLPTSASGTAVFSRPRFSPWDGTLVLPWNAGNTSGEARVEVYDSETGALLGTPIAPPAGGNYQQYGAAFGPNGHFYVVGYADRVFEYDLDSQSTIGLLTTQTNASGIGFSWGLEFKPLLGDRDGDWNVDADDAAAFETAFTGDGNGPPANYNDLIFDFDRDGDVDCADWESFLESWTEGDPLPALTPPCAPPAPVCAGDITGDHRCNTSDFNILANNFGSGPGMVRAQGDLSGDGMVNSVDFNILAGNFGCDANQ